MDMDTAPIAGQSRLVTRRQAFKFFGAAAAAASGGSLLAGCGSSGSTAATTATTAGSAAAASSGPAASGVASGASASAPASSTSATPAATSLSFLYYGDAGQQKQWNQLFGEFAKQHPEIQLKAQGIAAATWGDFFTQVSTRIAGGQKPDIIQVATEGQRLFASKGLLAPLDDYIAKDKAVVDEYLADLDPKLVEWNKTYSSPGGKTYYLPGEFNTMVMWCNNTLFAKAGVPLPSADWTWDDFHTAAQQITTKTGAFGYYASAEYFIGIMPWLLTNGTSSFDKDWKTATLGSPAAVEAADFNRKLVADKISPPPGGTFDRFTALAQDKLAMFGGGRWPIINERTLKKVDQITLVKWPKKVAEGSPVGWNGYPILQASENKDAAWTFIKFIVSAAGSAFFAKIGGTIVPARKSVAGSQDFLADSPKGTDLLYGALSYATPVPAPDKGAEIQKAIENAWQQVLAGNQSASAAMTAAQSATQKLV